MNDYTSSEEWRRICEARYVLAKPDKQSRHAYLSMVEKARGQPARKELEDEVMREWERRKQQAAA
jgi:hypothetical protein